MPSDQTLLEQEERRQEAKPHLGQLEQWVKVRRGTCPHFYTGIFIGHPYFHGTWGHTSLVLKEDGNEIETLNSRYTLGKPQKVLTMEEMASLTAMVTSKPPLGTPDEV